MPIGPGRLDSGRAEGDPQWNQWVAWLERVPVLVAYTRTTQGEP